MTDPNMLSLAGVMQKCAEAAPEAWFPSDYARDHDIPRDDLDPFLDELRIAGFVHAPDNVPGKGQGYKLTEIGERVYADPKGMAALRGGQLPVPKQVKEPGRSGSASLRERADDLRERFESGMQPVVTRYLIFANVLVFLVGIYFARDLGVFNEFLSGRAQGRAAGLYTTVLSKIGGLNPVLVARGEWWRTLSTCFVHLGLLHLGVNMYALWVLGRICELFLGRGRFLLLYFLSGFGGSCVAIWFKPVLAAGASGAICGLLGAFAVWLLLNRRILLEEVFAQWGRNIVINIILLAFISFIPGVSAAGHLGGGITGAVVAFLLHYQRYGALLQRWAALLGLVGVPIACFGLAQHGMNTVPEWIDLRRRIRLVDERNALVEQHNAFLDRSNSLLDATAPLTKLYNQRVYPLLQPNAKQRDQAEVANVLTELKDQRDSLESEKKKWQDPELFTDADFDAGRVLGLEVVESGIKLCQLSIAQLEAGDNNAAAFKVIDDEVKSYSAKKRRWQTVMRGLLARN